jgi:hypothetical protein
VFVYRERNFELGKGCSSDQGCKKYLGNGTPGFSTCTLDEYHAM